jgi:hypothetical protein
MANTHTAGFIIVAFLISLLWFRLNGMPLFPVGLAGSLAVAWWSQDIDRHFGKPSQLPVAVILSLLGAAIGFFV